ncbi:conserved hypothetical protein [Ricinus communis]|uniref:Uncharacterized protein n=1 Tax=Ricinus communis TaxID=3988 RepID=B9SSZ8_RICCO|nr:conserved hypothetical protein [Ricinus communis]
MDASDIHFIIEDCTVAWKSWCIQTLTQQGTWKGFVNCFVTVLACSSQDVFYCAEAIEKRIPAAIIDDSLITVFNSSTLYELCLVPK